MRISDWSSDVCSSDLGDAFARRHLDGGDLAIERARFLRLLRAFEAGDRERVLIGAGELIFGGGFLGEAAHQPAGLIGILEPVEEHMILEHIMPEPRARAMLDRKSTRLNSSH